MAKTTETPQRYIAPGIDDEATITVRLRLASPDVRDALAIDLFDIAKPGNIAGGLSAFIRDHDGVHLAGIDVTLPDFEPYQLTTGPASRDTPHVHPIS